MYIFENRNHISRGVASIG